MKIGNFRKTHRRNLARLLSLMLVVLMAMTFLPISANAAYGWEENEGLTLKFDDATTLWELGTWLSFGGSNITVARNNGEGSHIGLEVSGDVECPYAILELQDGTTYPAEYVLTDEGNICARLPIYCVPVGEPYRAEFRFVITRGDSGATTWEKGYMNDGRIFTSNKLTFDASATIYSPTSPPAPTI